MANVRRILPVVLVATLLGVWGGTQLAATASGERNANVPGMAGAVRAIGTLGTTSHGTAKKNYLQTDNLAGLSEPGGFTALDSPISVTCPGTSGSCTLELTGNIQYGASATAGNRYAIAWTVDGGFADQSPYSGVVPTASNRFQTTTWTTQFTGVTLGSHSVQLYAYTDAAASIYDFSLIVRVYRP